MLKELHKFTKRPSRAEIFQVWNAAKVSGDIPASWSFARHGRIEQVWGGYVLVVYR